ncbi:MAG: hypothetical protein QOJ93_1783 [Actinomycetota bacterium]|nr:hypothetical protein [Actinomycetota bacterium]
MVFPSGPNADLPGPEPFWLTLLATLCGLVLPAVTAIGAVILLGPPSIPHTSRLAAIAGGALTLAEAVFAGLVAGALVEAAWSRLHLPGSGPVDYLPVRWTRRRIARRRLIALSRGRVPRRGRSGRISRLCTEVGGAIGLSGTECEQARVAALLLRGAGEQVNPLPESAERLAAVVAAYDALLADRRDRPSLSHREAFEELRAMGGTGLDPGIVEALIDVEAANGRAHPGPFGSALSGAFRRGRHIVRTSVTPAAAGATVLAMATAGILGVLPAWRGTRVLGLRYSGPSVVVQTTPTQTGPADAASPSAGSSPKPTPTSPPASGTGNVGRTPGLYFPPPRTGLPSASPARPAPPATPGVVAVTESALPITVLPPSPSLTATPTPTPTKSTSPPPGGPVADRFVWVNQAGPMPTLDSPPLSTTSANELILAFVSSDGAGQSVSSLSGAGLNWSLAARANTLSGTAEVWQAYATAPLAGAIIRAAFASSGHGGSMTVAAFSRAAPAAGATAVAGAASGAPQVSVTTTKSRSLLWAVGYDADQAVARTPLAGQTMVHEFLDPAGGAGWVQATGPIAAANSVVSVGDSAPTLDRWELAAVEIPAAQ